MTQDASSRVVPQITVGMNVVALAGRRIDAENAEVARFPLDHVPRVREGIRTLFQQLGAQALVCSAACGTDLLALDTADELGLRSEVVLPFPPEQFRAASVIGRPGDWGPFFDHLIECARQHGTLRVIEHNASRHEAHRLVTEMLLPCALDLAKHTIDGAIATEPGRVTAVVVWEGEPRGPGDHTAHFAASAAALNIPVTSIYT